MTKFKTQEIKSLGFLTSGLRALETASPVLNRVGQTLFIFAHPVGNRLPASRTKTQKFKIERLSINKEDSKRLIFDSCLGTRPMGLAHAQLGLLVTSRLYTPTL
jgi:hypothetical protein